MPWFHPITIVINIPCFWLFYWFISYKPILLTIETYRYLFFGNEGLYCLGSSPYSTFMIKKIKDQKSFFYVKVLGQDIYFPSQMIVLHHKIRYTLPHISSQSYYNTKQILSVFMNMLHILGLILNSLPPMTATAVF